MLIELFQMSEWLTLDSNPKVISDFIKNLGVKGVRIEEVLDYDAIDNKNDS